MWLHLVLGPWFPSEGSSENKSFSHRLALTKNVIGLLWRHQVLWEWCLWWERTNKETSAIGAGNGSRWCDYLTTCNVTSSRAGTEYTKMRCSYLAGTQGLIIYFLFPSRFISILHTCRCHAKVSREVPVGCMMKLCRSRVTSSIRKTSQSG